MFEIKKGVIYHTRGDTGEFDINLKIEGEAIYEFDAVFSVKRNYKDTTYIYQRTAEEGHIRIPHSVTQNLQFGDYHYDIEIHYNDETEEGRYVTVGPYAYHLLPDVTVER